MDTLHNSEGVPRITARLQEWSRIGPAQDGQLRGLTLRDWPDAISLANSVRNKIDIREGYDGLEITTKSFVGQIDIGPLRIIVQPKLDRIRLIPLLRYAYGLRDLESFDETVFSVSADGFTDLLVRLLAAEVRNLVITGLAKRYVPLSQQLASPRGKILVGEYATGRSIGTATLPCRFHERRLNWRLNRVVRFGLGLAAQMTQDRTLARSVNGLTRFFDDVGGAGTLVLNDLIRAETTLDRQTESYRPTLTLIRLLYELHGVELEVGMTTTIRTSAFLFDMNLFYQRLLLRFLRDNLRSIRIEDQWPSRDVLVYDREVISRRRPPPKLKPDYAVFTTDGLQGFADAKYRDIWEDRVPSEWLYQLAIYAMGSPRRTSILLYASTTDGALSERLEVRQPMAIPGSDSYFVILRPVLLNDLVRLIEAGSWSGSKDNLTKYARSLISFEI